MKTTLTIPPAAGGARGRAKVAINPVDRRLWQVEGDGWVEAHAAGAHSGWARCRGNSPLRNSSLFRKYSENILGAYFAVCYRTHMDKTEAAIELLRKTETDLRRLVGEAAEAGEYEAVLRLTSWARQLAGLAAQAHTQSPAAATISARGERGGSVFTSRPRASSKRVKAGKGAASQGYPKFLRRGEFLVKIGWSKKQKKEYRHKAPHKALASVVTAVARAGQDGAMFALEQLMQSADAEDGSQLPNYQVYVCLAWLRQEGLIQQHGREGYTAQDPGSLAQTVEARWSALPTK